MNNLWQGIGGWLGSVFGSTKTPPSVKIAAAQNSGGTLRHQYESDRDLQELIQGTISDCMHARSSERSVIRLLVSGADPISTQLQKLLDMPNAIQSRIDFLESASQHYDANGNAIIFLIRDEQGLPTEQWLMPSRYFSPRFSSPDDPTPKAYQWQDGRATIEPDQLVIIRRNSIKTTPYKGRGILLDSEKNIRLWDMLLKSQSNYFENGGAPNVALKMAEGTDYSQDAISTYQKMWHDKYNAATGSTNIGVLPAGADIVNFGPQEVGYNETKAKMKEDICQAFQTPLMMLGDVGDANFNNGQVSVAMFERTCILRFAEKLAAAYEHNFRRTIHDSIRVTVDPDVLKNFTTLSDINGLNTNGQYGSHATDTSGDHGAHLRYNRGHSGPLPEGMEAGHAH